MILRFELVLQNKRDIKKNMQVTTIKTITSGTTFMADEMKMRRCKKELQERLGPKYKEQGRRYFLQYGLKTEKQPKSAQEMNIEPKIGHKLKSKGQKIARTKP